MKRLAVLVLLAWAAHLRGQSPVQLFTVVNGVVTPVSSTLTTGQISYTPPQVLAKCVNSGQIVDCNFSGSSSGTVNSGLVSQIAYYGGTGTAVSGNSALIKTTADSLFISDALPTSAGTNNVVYGIQSGSNIFHSDTTWFGGNNTLMGVKAGKALTSAADNTIVGYQAAQFLQGGSSTGCTPSGGSEEDGIVTAVGQNAAASLNTPTSGGCEISSDFYGQKAGANVAISFSDTYVGTHSGTNGTTGITTSNNSVFVGTWSGSGVAATNSVKNTFVGSSSGFNWAGGTIQHNSGVGYQALDTLDGTSANQADWNTAAGDSAGCSVTTGRFNTFLGVEAGGWAGNCPTNHITGNYNIGIGAQSIRTVGASMSGNNNIVVAAQPNGTPIITSGGQNVIISPYNAQGIGADNYMIGIGGSINFNSSGSEQHNIIIGDSGSTGGSGDNGDIAIGPSSSASGTSGGGKAIAIGQSASASATGAVAIGASATNSTANSVVLGGSSNTVVTLTGKGAVTSSAAGSGDLLDVFAPSLSAGNFIYSLMGVAASNNNSSSNPTFHYVGAGSTSNWASMNFFGNTNNNIAIMASGNNCVNHTTNDCATAWDVNGTVQASAYKSATNCSSSAAPAVCAAAPAGSVVIAAAGTTVTVNTTAVTANSQIFIQEDSSLGTKLSVTCNTTTGRLYTVTARTAATSFVITASAAPSTNPACLSYSIIN